MSKTVLITGANSGLGLDAARQLASLPHWTRVVVSARSQDKADGAIASLAERTGRPVSAFGTAVFDNNEPATIRTAVASLAEAGEAFDAVILNAGGVSQPEDGKNPPLTSEGYSRMFGMNVGGHAVLVDGLLERGLLKEGATVMFAASEASRGVSAMRIPAPRLPEGFGDLDATLEAVVRGQHGGKGYDPMVDYGLIKLIGTVWMRLLAERHGLRAIAVSPGFTGGTEAMNNLPAFQKFMFSYIALPLLKLFNNAHDLEVGAARYVQALEDQSLEAGGYYASPGKKVSGDLTAQDPALQPLLTDAAFEAAVGRLLAKRTGSLRVAS